MINFERHAEFNLSEILPSPLERAVNYFSQYDFKIEKRTETELQLEKSISLKKEWKFDVANKQVNVNIKKEDKTLKIEISSIEYFNTVDEKIWENIFENMKQYLRKDFDFVSENKKTIAHFQQNEPINILWGTIGAILGGGIGLILFKFTHLHILVPLLFILGAYYSYDFMSKRRKKSIEINSAK